MFNIYRRWPINHLHISLSFAFYLQKSITVKNQFFHVAFRYEFVYFCHLPTETFYQIYANTVNCVIKIKNKIKRPLHIKMIFNRSRSMWIIFLCDFNCFLYFCMPKSVYQRVKHYRFENYRSYALVRYANYYRVTWKMPMLSKIGHINQFRPMIFFWGKKAVRAFQKITNKEK